MNVKDHIIFRIHCWTGHPIQNWHCINRYFGSWLDWHTCYGRIHCISRIWIRIPRYYPIDFLFENFSKNQIIQAIIFAANVTRKSMKYNLKRPVANHFLQTFIPSMMISLTSAASVFIPSDNNGRMGMVITSFLSLVSLFNGAR